ncbi:MAG TPA: GNAT family N-acetyltransferase [Solirubrobacterales bacterium]|nr:GNAT family N-acetyltransferase [Solirubrobacterales bacterium]
MSSGYPAHREADVVLHDGSTVRLRPVRAGDQGLLQDLFERLSEESRAFRFFSGAVDLQRAAIVLADVDYGARYGLIATRGGEGRVVGHGLYVGDGDERAEVAFAVDEELQGRGLGTILLAHLAEVADENGISTFVAEVLPQNHRMIEVFHESGFPTRTSSEPGLLRVEMPTSFSEESLARFEERDRLAARAAVRPILEPRAVALVGASRREGSVGAQVFANLVESGYPGPFYPVNPAVERLRSVPVYPRVEAAPGEVDLAVIAVPAEGVVVAAREAAGRGARALVVLSAGFAETGEEGARRERDLLAVCRETGMRLVGPNCLGVLNTDPEAPLDVTFIPHAPPPGNVGFVSQSGALGLALAEFTDERRLGVSSFASVGNRADITANDFLEFWEEDGRTEVALLYIESFSDPRRFSRVSRRVGRKMPVVAMKSGRSAAGARAASSHTGALLAASDHTVDALFEQSGVVRAQTLAEMLDLAALFSSQPLPAGPRVAIVTNAGGPGIMCADACEAAGLEVPEAPPDVREALREFAAPQAGLGNPVDLIAAAGAEDFRRAIVALSAWEGVDAIISIFIRPLATSSEEVAAAIGRAMEELARPLPVQAVFMTSGERAPLAQASRVPTHAQPEGAARALGKALAYAEWRRRPGAEAPELENIRGDETAAAIAEALAEGREWLSAEECERVLGCYGVATPDSRLVADPAAAGEAAGELGGRVALKAHGAGIIHKSELGAVAVGLEGRDEVRAAAARMRESLTAQGLEPESFLVQRLVEGGTELLVGMATDPVFGPVLACGAGGTAVELLGDVALRVCPITRADADRMIRSLATFPLLTGFRGAPTADLESLEDLLLRVGALATAHDEIVELDLNPVLATPTAAMAADARIRIAPSPPPRSWPRTWV